MPKDSDGVPKAPEWIDYYPLLPDGTRASAPTGQIAYAIWEEAGKFDINMAGPDSAINGIAPHDLKIEDFATGSNAVATANLIAKLDHGNGRQRSNFSLREITSNTGDDQRIFSIEELLNENLVGPEEAVDLTTFTRDFDVRPEWDGNREAASAKSFLRSYVNNPDLYRLMAGAAAGAAGPSLVLATMNESALRAKLIEKGFPVTDSWMQIMRLLAALRLSLPPFSSSSAPAGTAALSPNIWYDEDIWGIALNVVLASDPISDERLVAMDYSIAENTQANTRYGARLAPYITEIAIKVEYGGTPGTVKVTEYIELWNPYPVDLSTKTYILGEAAGNTWPSEPPGSLTPRKTNMKEVSGPAPGQFKTVEYVSRSGMVLEGQKDSLYSQLTPNSDGKYGLRLRLGPYVTDKNYYNQSTSGSSGPWVYRVSCGPNFSSGGMEYMLMAWIPANAIPRAADASPVWYSFQIDDPRLGAFTRYSNKWKTDWTASGQGDQLTGNWKYTWQGYFNQHSLAGISGAGKVVSNFGDGYNINFGSSFPASWPKDATGLNRALATFALPGRPLRNVGEIGSVFAFRPWRTLSFSKTTAPEDSALAAGTSRLNWPATLLEYLTTVGTTSDSQTLNYRTPGNTPLSTFVDSNLSLRTQDNRWLFESTTTTGEPAGNLRPIRGRINLNTANLRTLTTLLQQRYRMVNSLGLRNWPGLNASPVGSGPIPDLDITIEKSDAAKVAQAIIDVRPLRSLADLAKLSDNTNIKGLYGKYPEPVMDAIMGRLAQFGTIRQQIYTVDILARTLNPKAKEKGKDVVTAEVRMLARVYFDTFSRKAFVESMEYR